MGRGMPMMIVNRPFGGGMPDYTGGCLIGASDSDSLCGPHSLRSSLVPSRVHGDRQVRRGGRARSTSRWVD